VHVKTTMFVCKINAWILVVSCSSESVGFWISSSDGASIMILWSCVVDNTTMMKV